MRCNLYRFSKNPPELLLTEKSSYSLKIDIYHRIPHVLYLLRGSAEWSAKREVAVLLGLTRGNHYAAQKLWLQRERIKAEASQVASAGSPQASQQALRKLTFAKRLG